MQHHASQYRTSQYRTSFDRYRPFALVGLLTLACVAACSDDDEPGDDGAGARAGSGTTGGSGGRTGGEAGAAGELARGGGAGEAPRGAAGAAGGGGAPLVEQGGAGGLAESGAGGDDGRHVLRPEQRPFDQAAFEALELPDGFSITVYRKDLGHARMLAVHGEHVYVTQPMQGSVIRLIDEDADGVAEAQEVVASNLPMVHGIAFHDDDVFLANVKSVYRGPVAADGSFGELTEIIDDLPDGGQHPLRTLGIGPDEQLYISIGSDCDACAETNPEHATILRSTLAGQPAGTRAVLASGLRNTIGFGWHPVTEQLWGMDHGSDWRGDDLPPEELNAIDAGKNYGWPYCYGNRRVDPIIQDPPDTTKAAFCATTEPPVLQSQAHEAPIGMVFYTGGTFPERYTNGAFVAFHGSWNRKPATGYRVAFIPFESGVPQAVEGFVEGFLIEDGTATFGRPAGIAVAPDGALLFTDDTNGIVYRVQYE